MKYLLIIILLSGCHSIPVEPDEAENMYDESKVKVYKVKQRFLKITIECKD